MHKVKEWVAIRWIAMESKTNVTQKIKKTYNKMNELTIGSIPFGLVQNTILHLEVNLIPNKYIPLL